MEIRHIIFPRQRTSWTVYSKVMVNINIIAAIIDIVAHVFKEVEFEVILSQGISTKELICRNIIEIALEIVWLMRDRCSIIGSIIWIILIIVLLLILTSVLEILCCCLIIVVCLAVIFNLLFFTSIWLQFFFIIAGFRAWIWTNAGFAFIAIWLMFFSGWLMFIPLINLLNSLWLFTMNFLLNFFLLLNLISSSRTSSGNSGEIFIRFPRVPFVSFSSWLVSVST